MNRKTHFDTDAFCRLPIVGILRGFSLSAAVEAAQAAATGGLTAIEITMNSSNALAQIEAVRQALPAAIMVGAGTVTTGEQVRQAANAGASFIVSPVVDHHVIKSAGAAGMPVFPGAMTPTEILSAARAGAQMVKLFPAGALGPAYLKAVKAPLDRIPLLATGGIGLDNLDAFLRAGADAFGIGGPLFDREKVQARNWGWLTDRVKQFGEAIATFRQNVPRTEVTEPGTISAAASAERGGPE